MVMMAWVRRGLRAGSVSLSIVGLAVAITACNAGEGDGDGDGAEPAGETVDGAGDEGSDDAEGTEDASSGPAEDGAENGDLFPVQYQLVWTAGSADAAVYVAEAEGFFAEEGLEVEIIQSQDPTAAPGLVGSGERDIGVSYPPDILLAVDNGIPLISVSANYQVNPLGIVSLADQANITRPEDLVDKTVALTPLPIDQLLFDRVLEEAGISRDQMDTVDPGFNGGELVGEGQVDGASGVPWFEVSSLSVAGLDPILMEYRDFGGLDFPFITTIVNEQFAEDNPDVVRAFLRGQERGWDHVKANPDEAMDALLEAVPNLDRETQSARLDVILPLIESEATQEHGFGYLDLDQLQALADALAEEGLLATPLEASEVFTNDFRNAD